MYKTGFTVSVIMDSLFQSFNDQHLEGDEGHLQEQEAAHQEARVSKQVPVPAVVQTVDIKSLTKAPHNN